MNKKLIIYHGPGCWDGFAAAWCFYKKYPDAEFYPARHDNAPPPDVSGKDVFIVDFAYSREIMIELKSKANSLVLLDHHKSAMEKLSDLDFCHFDMKRSGAGLAWDYCFVNEPRHWLIDCVEDKDLWRWKFSNSREISCVLQSYPQTFATLDLLSKEYYKDIIKDGEIILRYQRQIVSDIVKKAQEIEMQGHKVLCVNTPILQSEVAGFLAINRPFGVAYFINEIGHKIYSLRSKEDGVDVSQIAAKYPGGGGHARSAGFRLIGKYDNL